MDLDAIEVRAHQLCEKYSKCNQYQITERNKKIIEELREEYDISEEIAVKCFMNNHK